MGLGHRLSQLTVGAVVVSPELGERGEVPVLYETSLIYLYEILNFYHSAS